MDSTTSSSSSSLSSVSSLSTWSSGSTPSSWSSRSSWSSASYSSASSLSSSSQSSSSSSSSSVSTESSAWDTNSLIGSYIAASITAKAGTFVAIARVNLTYDDAITCLQFGPCEIQLGGIFHGEMVPERVVQLCDDRAYTHAFRSYDAAHHWIMTLRQRMAAVLRTVRTRRAVFGAYRPYRQRTLP